MKKTTIVALCVPLFLVGLFCIHLAAQPDGRDIPRPLGTLVFNASLSVLDPKVGELSERELLEMKVDRARKIFEFVDNARQAGMPTGRATLFAEAQANLAAAEVELYRTTGEQDKLHAALEAKVKALTEKVRAAISSYEHATMTIVGVCEAETQLLDALLERKRARSPAPRQ